MNDVEATVAVLDKSLSKMIRNAEYEPELKAKLAPKLLGLHKYLGGIFQLSKTVAKIPKDEKLGTLTRIRYYYKIASLINSIPSGFRSKDNQLKIMFDRVVLSANAMAKVTPDKKKQYSTTFAKSMVIFTKYAAKTITDNIQYLNRVMAKRLDPRELRKFRDTEQNIMRVCADISGKAGKWPTYAASGLVSVPEVTVAAAAALFTWAALWLMITATFLESVGAQGPGEAGLPVILGFGVPTLVGMLSLDMLANKLGFKFWTKN
jgi:hypothetical protein